MKGLCHWSELSPDTLLGSVYVALVNKATSRIGREYGSLPLVSIVLTHSEGEGGGWCVRVTLVKKNTSRARREEGSLPLVGVVPSHSAGISICHSGEQGH